MARSILQIVLICILATVTIYLILTLRSVRGELSDATLRLGNDLRELQGRIDSLRAEVDSARAQSPGLGEYMTTVQLHAAKLWFASHAGNWGLAEYELGELTETIEAAELLHARKNNVDISAVLESVRGTQLVQLHRAIEKKDRALFVPAYRQTLDACNGCHRSAGYPFIHLIEPAAPPVSNQQFTPDAGR